MKRTTLLSRRAARLDVLAVLAALLAVQPASASVVVVGAGATVDLGSGTIDNGCSDLVVAGTLQAGTGQVIGVDSLSTLAGGQLAGEAGVLAWSGDWANLGQFLAGTSSASWVDGCGRTTSSMAGDDSFHSLAVLTSSGREIRFTSGETTTVAAAFAAAGAPGQLLRVRSTTPDVQAYLALLAGATQSAQAVDVADNHAIGLPIGFPGPASDYGSIKGANSLGWFDLLTYSITAAADPAEGGSASCDPNPVEHGGTSVCSANEDTGYTFSHWSGDCTGATCELSGVTASQSVTAHFTLDTLDTYQITAAADPAQGGTASCDPNPVEDGGTSVCTANANTGYTFSHWSGDCTGASCELTGVTASQSVTAHFTLDTYAITAAADPADGGTASCDPNPVEHGGTSVCTANANSDYAFSHWSGDCTGATCELTDVTGLQTVIAHFLRTRMTVPTATGRGDATISIAGPGCNIDFAQFITAPPPLPDNTIFPFGLADFVLTGCTDSVTVTIDYPTPYPLTGARYWKEDGGVYTEFAALLDGSSATFVLTDNASGDSDPELGTIHDPSGVGIAAHAIPVLGPWGVLLLTALLGLLAVAGLRNSC